MAWIQSRRRVWQVRVGRRRRKRLRVAPSRRPAVRLSAPLFLEHHRVEGHRANRLCGPVGLGAALVRAYTHPNAPPVAVVQLLSKGRKPFIEQPGLRLARVGFIGEQTDVDVVARCSADGGTGRWCGLRSRRSRRRRCYGSGWGCADGCLAFDGRGGAAGCNLAARSGAGCFGWRLTGGAWGGRCGRRR